MYKIKPNKPRSRYMHYKRYMRWVEFCKECKAHGLNPYSNKGNIQMACGFVASFIRGLTNND